ncbi:MAG: DUF4363 family protein [Oscillospiraceae bacterium]
MKSLYISITIIILVFIFSIYSLFTLYEHKDSLMDIIDDIEISINNDDFKSQHKIIKLQNKWIEVEKWLTSITDHKMLDSIDESVASLMPLYEHQEKAELLSNISILKAKINKMVLDETPTLNRLL